MYIHTLTKLMRGQLKGDELELPVPLTLSLIRAEVRVLEGVDNRVLVIYDLLSPDIFDEIKGMSERVGGRLNGSAIEIDLGKSRMADGVQYIPFIGLDQPYKVGILPRCQLVVEIV
jgi:hypothetical protein